jgi:hypothetical protein
VLLVCSAAGQVTGSASTSRGRRRNGRPRTDEALRIDRSGQGPVRAQPPDQHHRQIGQQERQPAHVVAGVEHDPDVGGLPDASVRPGVAGSWSPATGGCHRGGVVGGAEPDLGFRPRWVGAPRRRWPGCGGRAIPPRRPAKSPGDPGRCSPSPRPVSGRQAPRSPAPAASRPGAVVGLGRQAEQRRLPPAGRYSGVGVRGAAPVPRRRWVAVGGER